MHRIRQKKRDFLEIARLAIFNVKVIHKILDAKLLLIEHVLTYLDAHNKEHYISNTYRTWIDNCQKHLFMNYLSREALMNWIL